MSCTERTEPKDNGRATLDGRRVCPDWVCPVAVSPACVPPSPPPLLPSPRLPRRPLPPSTRRDTLCSAAPSNPCSTRSRRPHDRTSRRLPNSLGNISTHISTSRISNPDTHHALANSQGRSRFPTTRDGEWQRNTTTASAQRRGGRSRRRRRAAGARARRAARGGEGEQRERVGHEARVRRCPQTRTYSFFSSLLLPFVVVVGCTSGWGRARSCANAPAADRPCVDCAAVRVMLVRARGSGWAC